MAQLKPCPFCGGEPTLFLATARETDPYREGDRIYPMARCNGCYTDVPGKNGDRSTNSAVGAWNRRTPQQSPEGAVSVTDAMVEAAGRAAYIKLKGLNPDYPIHVNAKGYRQEPYVSSVPAWQWEYGHLARTILDAALSLPAPQDASPAQVSSDWRDDPSADERWNAGLDYGLNQLCAVLGVDPKSVNWDAATETLEGDVCSVICSILERAPLSATLSAQDAPSASLAGWRLIERGEIIESDDEAIADDAVTWEKVARWAVGSGYHSAFKSIRRRKASPEQGEAL